jgi:bis(5'-nucleosyl)-tetraphosphatase (symmetrical)
MSTYVIGDVHGCHRTLRALLQTIQYKPNHDTLWFTGDLVNRGPDSHGVLAFVMNEPNAHMVLGNHDIYLMVLADNPKLHERYPDLATLYKDPNIKTHIAWLKQQPLIHYDSSHDVLLVHAGIPPMWDTQKALALGEEVHQAFQQETTLMTAWFGNTPTHWDDQLTGSTRLRLIINYLTRMRFIAPDGTLHLEHTGPVGTQPNGVLPWFELLPKKGPTIVFGHWASLSGKADHPRVEALDGGCVWKNKLIALRLDDRRRFEVPYQD